MTSLPAQATSKPAAVSAIVLCRCEDTAVWDAFVASSPQENVFSTTPFLRALDVEADRWFLLRDGRPQVGALLLRRQGQTVQAPYAYTMYQGLLLSKELAGEPTHSRHKVLPELLQTLADGLSKHYDRLSFCLHHTLDDLRGLQWFHYQEPQNGRFKLDLWYTGIINLKTVGDIEKYLTSIRVLRRRDFHKASSQGITVRESNDIDMLAHLYQLTFSRQGLETSPEHLSLLRSIVSSALAQGFGRLTVCATKLGEVASATLFLEDSHSAYYLIGANDPAHRNTGSATYLMVENIRYYRERGLERFDLCGINSPNRGDFKTSFNAVAVPYLSATWTRPAQ